MTGAANKAKPMGAHTVLTEDVVNNLSKFTEFLNSCDKCKVMMTELRLIIANFLLEINKKKKKTLCK